MVEYPVQQGCGQHWVAHHLRPVHNLLVCGKDNGGGLIGVADKGKEPVGLAPGDRGVPDLVLWEV